MLARTENLSLYSVRFQGTDALRPVDPAGDAFYGLEPGTNGTAAECRRQAFPARTWVRHDGREARGLWYAPPR